MLVFLRFFSGWYYQNQQSTRQHSFRHWPECTFSSQNIRRVRRNEIPKCCFLCPTFGIYRLCWFCQGLYYQVVGGSIRGRSLCFHFQWGDVSFLLTASLCMFGVARVSPVLVLFCEVLLTNHELVYTKDMDQGKPSWLS